MSMEKRIVFEHTNGPLKGLREIMGTISQLKDDPEGPLPDHAEGFEAQGRFIEFASLIEARRHCMIYREALFNTEGEHFPVKA